MKQQVDLPLVRRYSGGKYSFGDLKKIAKYFNCIRFRKKMRNVIAIHWNEFSVDEDDQGKDLSAVFAGLKKKIQEGKKEVSLLEEASAVYVKIAAILLFPLLVYSGYMVFEKFYGQPVNNRQWIEVISPGGGRIHFSLPDGTKVSMNSGTRLKYVSDFTADRRVSLDGEAYFDVIHDSRLPFVVHTEALNIQVLGTKFNVVALSDEPTTEVVLEEGKVHVTGNHESFFADLKPNEGFYYNKKLHEGKIKRVDASELTAWKDGLLIFRSEPLVEVLTRIGRWYNVRFDIQDKEVESFRYRATFHDEPLEEVLRLIALTAPVEYRINERKMNKNGIYDEKRITIKLKK